ncbi:MAG: GEVED domain-containing protein [Methylophagaceae bacterium]
MNRILLPFLLLFAYYNISAQVGAGPATDCTSSIPEICSGGSYPASIAGIARAPGASFSCNFGGTNTIDEQTAFFYFEAGTTGPLKMQIDPVDPFTGAVLVNPQDLDFMCWGPFSSTATMCNGLTSTNLITCSFSAGATEYCILPNVIAGQFYVILVTNWEAAQSPADCNIQFTPDTSLAAGGYAGGSGNTLNPCSTDPTFNLIDGLNGNPDGWGYWTDASGNPVGDTFNPVTDPGGVYWYWIDGTANCDADSAFLTINIISSSTVSITSSDNTCSGDSEFTLTASPSGGTFSGNGVNGITSTFTPDTSLLGANIISYVYNANGCSVTVTQDLIVNGSPTVLPADVVSTNPSCFGDCDGTATITATLGDPTSYTYDWFGENPLALCAGVFNYTVTDGNNCSFSDNITIYDPANNLGVLTAYNSSCYGENDGEISVQMFGGTTPPGTISDPDPDGDGIPYCLSSPDITNINSAGGINEDVTIEEVILIGDANTINNNTAGVIDYYEDYTSTMYADITEGQSYTVNLILGDFSAGSYPSGAKVFIDYNIDGDFNDAGEEIGILNSSALGDISNIGFINFTVPSTGAFGPTRMRVVSQDPWSN